MPSDFNSASPDGAFWFIETPTGVWRQSGKGHDVVAMLQRAVGVPIDGAWGPATLRALDQRLRATGLTNALRYLDGFNPEWPGVTDGTLRAAIWYLDFIELHRDVTFGRIKVPSDTTMPAWRVSLQGGPGIGWIDSTRVGDAFVPFGPTETSVPTEVIQQAALVGATPSPASETPVVAHPQTDPVVRPIGLPNAPAPVRPTGVSWVAVAGAVGAVVILGAIAVSLSQQPNKTRATRSTARSTRRKR